MQMHSQTILATQNRCCSLPLLPARVRARADICAGSKHPLMFLSSAARSRLLVLDLTV